MDWGLGSTILTVVFGIVSIVSVIVAIRLARRRLPTWGYETKKLIGLGSEAPPELKLTFGDKPVADVFRTVVVFYNDGREAIRSNEDVINPIAVNFSGATILREPSVRPSNDDIEFRAKREEGSVSLTFKYLDHQDGALVEVFHTASAKPQCQGKIIGTKGISFKGAPVDYELTLTGKVFAALFIPFLIGCVVFAVLFWNAQWAGSNWVALALCLSGIMVSIFARAFVKLIFSMRFPKWSIDVHTVHIAVQLKAKRREE
jgi:hypothetical protein